MAETLWGSLADALRKHLVLYAHPCQHIDGYSKPEVEVLDSPELLLPGISITRPKQEEVLIERSINSVRINVKVILLPEVTIMARCTPKRADFRRPVQLRPVEPLEAWLRSKRLRFIQQRADQYRVLRRVPVAGHDLSFLITAEHMQVFDKARVISFVCMCIEDLSSAAGLKRLALARGRSISSDFTVVT